MKTLFQFSKVSKNQKVVVTEVWCEKDGTPKHLRRTTLNPTSEIKKFRQEVSGEDMEQLKKAIKEEIRDLDECINVRKKLVRMLNYIERLEHPNMTGLAFTAQLINREKD